MIANFHTHTYRCRHAIGQDREYVESAIKRGLKVLGFSDHSPYVFDSDYYSSFRMRLNEIEGYISSLTSLREEFKDQIKIYIGYEMEYYPKYFDKTIELMKHYGCDYLILGQHYIYNEIGALHNTKPCDDEKKLIDYVDTIIEAINTEKFFYIAHPDVLNFTGDVEKYKKEMFRLCKAAKESNTPLEINMLGLRDNRFYPRKDFWEVAGEVDCDAILGCDAHNPDHIALESDINKAKEFAKEFNINIVEPLKPTIFLK